MKSGVLIIVNSFPPPVNGGSMRIYKLVKYLLRKNIDVYVLCNAHDIEKDIMNHKHLEKEVGKATFISVPAFGRSKKINASAPTFQDKKTSFWKSWKSYLNKMLEMFLIPDAQRVRWNKKAFRAAKEIILNNGIKNLITSSPPHSTQIVGLQLKEKFGPELNWIADFRDMWSLSHDFEYGYRRFRYVNMILEKKVLSLADQVVVVSDSIRQITLDKFNLKDSSKLKVITNGYDPEDFREPIEYIRTEKISFYFLGSVFGSMANNMLAEALDSFDAHETDLEFKFVGAFCDSYRERFSNTSAVSFHSSVSHSDAVKIMCKASFLILILTNDDEGKRAFSGKFFEYLAAGRPILALVPEGEVASLVRQYSLGEVANPADIDEIRASIRKMVCEISKWQSYKVPEFLLSKFSREHTTSLFEELLK